MMERSTTKPAMVNWNDAVIDGDRSERRECRRSFCTCEIVTLPSVRDYDANHGNFDCQKKLYRLMRTSLGMRSSCKNFRQKVQRRLASFFCDVVPMFCCPPCPNAIITKIALAHLDKPTYDFVPFGRRDGGEDESSLDLRLHRYVGSSLFARSYSRRYLSYFAQLRCFYLDDGGGGGGGRIACMIADGFSSTRPKVKSTILYSHNNGDDLAMVAGYVVRMARRCSARILSYDYPGFGQSNGPCTDEGVYRSGEIAYDYLTKTMKIPPNEIVLIGTSLGTAVTIHLASTRPVKGVVLQGAFMSALRVVCPFERPVVSKRGDRFTSIEKIGDVHAPTLFVHGRKDELFGIRHATILRANCPGAATIEPYYVDGGSHLDFDEKREYWIRLHDFLHKELVLSMEEGAVCCGQSAELPGWEAILIDESGQNAPKPMPVPVLRANRRVPIALCDKCLVGSAIK